MNICICIRAYSDRICICICTYIHTYMQTYTNKVTTHIHYPNIPLHTYKHAIHKYTIAPVQPYKCIAYTHAYINEHTHAHVNHGRFGNEGHCSYQWCVCVSVCTYTCSCTYLARALSVVRVVEPQPPVAVVAPRPDASILIHSQRVLFATVDSLYYRRLHYISCTSMCA